MCFTLGIINGVQDYNTPRRWNNSNADFADRAISVHFTEKGTNSSLKGYSQIQVSSFYSIKL